MVTPDEETQARIKAEAARVRTARETRQRPAGVSQSLYLAGPGHCDGPVSAPAACLMVSPVRRIGRSTSPRIPARRSWRPRRAKVIFAEDLYLSGKTVIIDHGHGLSSSYLHLDSISVAVGEEVEQGQTHRHGRRHRPGHRRASRLAFQLVSDAARPRTRGRTDAGGIAPSRPTAFESALSHQNQLTDNLAAVEHAEEPVAASVSGNSAWMRGTRRPSAASSSIAW